MICHRLCVSVVALFAIYGGVANACLPAEYSQLLEICREKSPLEKLFSVIFGNNTNRRQIAVVAGVSHYPNLAPDLQYLPPVDHDIDEMIKVLRDDLSYDEIIVLKNAEFNFENLTYIFQRYLPDVLSGEPESAVLFTFSGHGDDFENNGYLFTYMTSSIEIDDFDDTEHTIPLDLFRTLLRPTIIKSKQFLTLINSCNGGYFLDNRAFVFGEVSLNQKSAHGITAGGAEDKVRALPKVGSGKGSVFFEMVLAALKGEQVTLVDKVFNDPSSADGILGVTELAAFLVQTIQIIENYRIRPRMGTLSTDTAAHGGEFFFVTDENLAKASLSQTFPDEFASIFGIRSPTPNHKLFSEGFLERSAAVQTSQLISDKNRSALNFRDNYWPIKTIVKSSRETFYAPRAVVVGDTLYMFYIGLRGKTLRLYEEDQSTGVVRIVDAQPEGTTGYIGGIWADVIGDAVYYQLGLDAPVQKYVAGSNSTPIVVFDFELPVYGISSSPNQRYVAGFDFVKAYLWTDFENATAEERLVYGVAGEGGALLEQVSEAPGPNSNVALQNLEGGEDSAPNGIMVYDRLSGERQLIFSQSQMEDRDESNWWAVGHVAWSPDGTRLYFDNSGPLACIWEYDLHKRELTKIVPEHNAADPFPFEYGGKIYIIFTDMSQESTISSPESAVKVAVEMD